jgi:hypothetical protein
MRKTLIAFVVLISSLNLFAAKLENAKVVEHDASRGVGAQIRQLAGSASTVWMSWDEPAADPDSCMCCFASTDEGQRHQWRAGRCTLGAKGGNFFNGTNDAGPPVSRTSFAIFARAEEGSVVELRLFSEDCIVDARGATIHHLGGVTPAESIAWLEAYAKDKEPRSKKDSHQAVGAIAMHRAPQVLDALERLLKSARSDEVRGHAAFWIGARGGARGRQVLRGVIDDEGSRRILDQAIAGIAQDEDRAATDMLLALARTHRSTEVRKQSIFWLGQRAGEKATANLKEATNDPDDEVREMAVFSISQLPREQAVPELIQLARTHKSRVVREKALFWLGQSGDPRALDFIEEVLTK